MKNWHYGQKTTSPTVMFSMLPALYWLCSI